MDDQFKPSNVSRFKFPIKIGARALIIIGVIAVLLVAAGGYWYWSKSKQAPSEEGSSLGSEIFDKTQNSLGGQVPDTNPFKDQKNPLDSLYQNPFE